jgi:hypothetical protein
MRLLHSHVVIFEIAVGVDSLWNGKIQILFRGIAAGWHNWQFATHTMKQTLLS